MPYRNKTFVSFASEDIHYYRLMCAWRQNTRFDFDFFDAHDINVTRDSSQPGTINRRLSERLANTKQVVMLIGDHTRWKAADSASFVYHEARTIRRLRLPVIFANLNKSRNEEKDRIPDQLIDLFTISVPFGIYAIKDALDDFPSKFFMNERLPNWQQKTGPFSYDSAFYVDVAA